MMDCAEMGAELGVRTRTNKSSTKYGVCVCATAYLLYLSVLPPQTFNHPG